eukprot:CAMPEP_0183295214 /NCGR_PEP_ID=MMETSP0160_2-20130417/3253_1 /TAXON_ID=2839 ORGANISM="Odontella Sinensis, Strain Grunow 1884" /NCGR_SAMPLE_ID=MMETSP0160_2 /ASSEMBLY_ACC=CAM_ASM_000250 /LENGTH=107 /DNA_ID=CAMNT_0025456657 /DNA_START=123 /DNA_END=446 /DNA_ORIENTATION=-
MKSIAALFAVLASSSAFVPAPRPTPVTFLRSITYEPPADEYESEESIFDRKRKERQEHDDEMRARYRAQGIELTEADLTESVDQYQNAATGGNLIAGISLSALCEDD